MKFATNKKTCIILNILLSYKNKTTEEVGITKFLGLQTDNLSWNKCTKYVIPKLTSARFAIKALSHLRQ
jgi:hypothetical protein